ncbi:MAG: sulfatase-like hydrolase/transferase [Litorivicinus sp.]
MNILFVMYDQLRFDYLSCAGHPTLHTPHFDRIAKMGVQFTHAYAPSTICGSSRMSFYTGRYTSSHGAHRNNYPLRVGEQTLGDHMRRGGWDAYLIGKTHMVMDREGMQRMGLDCDSTIGARVAQSGFDVVVRDDGLWPQGVDGIYNQTYSPYNDYLKQRGYESDNPWHDYANSAIGPGGEILSGWLMCHADQPANIRNEDSETPWLTQQFLNWLDEPGRDAPWLCHLSYIKPHWPYIVPAPYHALYGPQDVIPANKSEAERLDPHPVFAGFQQHLIGQTFAKEATRTKAIPAYMGLIKQCDDELGRILDRLESSGEIEHTMIVVTSDHGDYLGDHWMGEKDLFHDCSVRIPLLIFDPRAQADSTRGTRCDALVEGIDLAATFVEATGQPIPDHVIEGRSLQPWLNGESPTHWRHYVISEYDYAPTPIARELGLAPRDARCVMVATHEWKLIHFHGGLPPMLFDRTGDPNELNDLGRDPQYQAQRDQLYGYLHEWSLRMSQRTALSEAQINAMRGQPERVGVLRGLYDGAELPDDWIAPVRGRARKMT